MRCCQIKIKIRKLPILLFCCCLCITPSNAFAEDSESEATINNYYDYTYEGDTYNNTYVQYDDTVIQAALAELKTLLNTIDSTQSSWQQLFGTFDGTQEDWNTLFKSWDAQQGEWDKLFNQWESTRTTWNTLFADWEETRENWESLFDDWDSLFGDWDETFKSCENLMSKWDGTFEQWNQMYTYWNSVFYKWDVTFDDWTLMFEQWAQHYETWNLYFSKLNSFIDELRSIVPRVGAIYSVNRSLPNCYYRPTFQQVSNYLSIPEEIMYLDGYAAVYTGYYDLTLGTDVVDSFKPEGKQSRALEILGYDILLSKEVYDFASDAYIAEEYAGTKCTLEYSLMCLYKALGKNILSYDYTTVLTPEISLINSPIGHSLGSFVQGIEAYSFNVFVTRTNMDAYFKKAMTDLQVYPDSRSYNLTGGDFIRLAKTLMERYGEPVIATTELNQLMQIYGGNIPTYLSDDEREAYVYLKARGCLNDESLCFYEPITPSQMYDILMCIADENSRSTFKELQPILILNQDLVNEGYFPKQVTISTGENAFDVSMDYSRCNYYDYFVVKDDTTEFLSKDGAYSINNLFIANKVGEPDKGALLGTEYCGIVTVDSKEYYHFRANTEAPSTSIKGISDYATSSEYFKKDTNYYQVNTANGSDTPYYWWLEYGGGVYTIGKSCYEDGVHTFTVLHREPFPDTDAWRYCVDEERRGVMQVSLLEGIKNFFSPRRVNAADLDNICTLELEGLDTSSLDNLSSVTSNIDGSYSLSAGIQQEALALLKLAEEVEANQKFTAIANIYGKDKSIMTKLPDFMEAGTILECDTSQINRNILILYSTMGVIKLNNDTNEIVVGSSIYKVPKSKVPYLFKYDASLGGDYSYWIDFRAIYGWSANEWDFSISVGTGDSYAISYKSVDKVSDTKIGSYPCYTQSDEALSSHSRADKIYALKKNALGNFKNIQMLNSTTYPLANWVILNIVGENGLEENYCVVYYSKEIIEYLKIRGLLSSDFVVADHSAKVLELLGYEILPRDESGLSSWCCRVFKLDRVVSNVDGQFSYSDEYGFVYNIPSNNDWSLEKYFTGECILPLSLVKETGSITYVRNNNISYTDEVYDSLGMHAVTYLVAPAGIPSLFGGGVMGYLTVSSINSSNFLSDAVLYYGTTQVNNFSLTKEGESLLNLYTQDGKSVSIAVQNDDKLYHVYSHYFVNDENVVQLQDTYILLDNNLEVSTLDTQEVINVVEFVDKESTTKWGDFEIVKLQDLLKSIDDGTSFLILFIFKIIPGVGIILLTLLVGFSAMSDNKIIVKFFDKVFDPVYFITFGNLKMSELKMSKSFLTLFIGYVSFTLIYNGNALRLIEVGASWFMQFIQILRNT